MNCRAVYVLGALARNVLMLWGKSCTTNYMYALQLELCVNWVVNIAYMLVRCLVLRNAQ